MPKKTLGFVVENHQVIGLITDRRQIPRMKAEEDDKQELEGQRWLRRQKIDSESPER